MTSKSPNQTEIAKGGENTFCSECGLVDWKSKYHALRAAFSAREAELNRMKKYLKKAEQRLLAKGENR